jgi:hypothetical protein
MQGLQAAAAQAIDRRPAGFDRQSCHQSNGTCDIESLLHRLLCIAEQYIFDFRGIDSGPFDERFNTGDREVIAADVSKQASVFVSPADWRAQAIDDDGGFHNDAPRCTYL